MISWNEDNPSFPTVDCIELRTRGVCTSRYFLVTVSFLSNEIFLRLLPIHWYLSDLRIGFVNRPSVVTKLGIVWECYSNGARETLNHAWALLGTKASRWFFLYGARVLTTALWHASETQPCLLSILGNNNLCRLTCARNSKWGVFSFVPMFCCSQADQWRPLQFHFWAWYERPRSRFPILDQNVMLF